MKSAGYAKEIQSIDQWIDAFFVFAAFYMEVYPEQGPGLLRYGKFIKETARKCGGLIWQKYDKGFRKQKNHHGLAWDRTH